MSVSLDGEYYAHDDLNTSFQSDEFYEFSERTTYGEFSERTSYGQEGEDFWPQLQVARPSVKSVKQFYFPPIQAPAPLRESIVKEHDAYSKNIENAATLAVECGKAVAMIQENLAKAENAAKTVNKWSSSNKDKHQLVSRLTSDLRSASTKAETIQASIDTMTKESKCLLEIIALNTLRVEAYADYVAFKATVPY